MAGSIISLRSTKDAQGFVRVGFIVANMARSGGSQADGSALPGARNGRRLDLNRHQSGRCRLKKLKADLLKEPVLGANVRAGRLARIRVPPRRGLRVGKPAASRSSQCGSSWV
jgi:hypothetical protein